MRLVYHYDDFIKDIVRTMLPRHKKSNGSEYPGSAQRHERSGNVPCFDRRPRTAVKDDLTKKKMSGFDGCSVSAVQDAGYGRRRGHECKCTSDFGRLLRSATACFCGVFQ